MRDRRNESIPPGQAQSHDPRRWVSDKWPVLRFLVMFGLMMAAFYAVLYLPPDRFLRVHQAFTGYLRFYAVFAGWVLDLFGEGVTVSGQSIVSPRFAVQIVRGCDAIEATAMLVAAMIASPVSISRKAVGVLVGASFLGLVNLIRIVSLFYVGIYWPTVFETIHMEVWQPVFIVLAVAAWLLWAVWARRTSVKPAPAPAPARPGSAPSLTG